MMLIDDISALGRYFEHIEASTCLFDFPCCGDADRNRHSGNMKLERPIAVRKNAD